jgi:hypothetical protein
VGNDLGSSKGKRYGRWGVQLWRSRRVMLWRNKRRPFLPISYLILITVKEDHAVRNSNRDCIISETIPQKSVNRWPRDEMKWSHQNRDLGRAGNFECLYRSHRMAEPDADGELSKRTRPQ